MYKEDGVTPSASFKLKTTNALQNSFRSRGFCCCFFPFSKFKKEKKKPINLKKKLLISLLGVFFSCENFILLNLQFFFYLCEDQKKTEKLFLWLRRDSESVRVFWNEKHINAYQQAGEKEIWKSKTRSLEH